MIVRLICKRFIAFLLILSSILFDFDKSFALQNKKKNGKSISSISDLDDSLLSKKNVGYWDVDEDKVFIRGRQAEMSGAIGALRLRNGFSIVNDNTIINGDSGNVDYYNRLKNDAISSLSIESKNDIKKENIFYNITVPGDFSIRSNLGQIGYARNLVYFQEYDVAYLDDNFFITESSEKVSALKINKNHCDVNFKYLFFSSCARKDYDDLYDIERSLSVKKDYTLPELPRPKNDIETKRFFNSLPIHIRSSSANYNTETEMIKMKNISVRAYGVPIFYFPYISMIKPNDSKGKTGFLIPKPVFFGRRQGGIEIPFYVHFNTNHDLLLSATFYGQIPEPLGNTKEPTGNKLIDSIPDNRRIRENHFNFTHRFLVSQKYNRNSFFFNEGSFTERTALLGSFQKTAKTNSDGDIVFGSRFHIKSYGDLALSKKVSLRYTYFNTSDGNYTFFYLRQILFNARNSAMIDRTDDKSHHNFQIISWKPIFMPATKGTLPEYYIRESSLYNTNSDRFGGYFRLENISSYNQKMQGYDVTRQSNAVTYKNSFITKLGQRISFDGKVRSSYYHGYASYFDIFSAQNSSSANAQYGAIMDLSSTGPDIGRKTGYFTFLPSFATNVEHIFIGNSKNFTALIKPRVSFFQNPNYSSNVLMLDNFFDQRFSFQSAFSNGNYTNKDIFNSGSTFIAGGTANIRSLSNYKISKSFVMRDKLTNNNILEDNITRFLYFGFENSYSLKEYYGNFNFAMPSGISLNHDYKINNINGVNKVTEKQSTLNIPINFNTKIISGTSFTVGLNELNYPNNNFSMLFVSFSSTVFDRIGVSGLAAYNLKPNTVNGHKMSNLIFARLRFEYDLGCIMYYFMISQTASPMVAGAQASGVPSSYLIYRFGVVVK